jgi:hypothetical protein
MKSRRRVNQPLGGFLLSTLLEHAEQKGPTIYSLNIPD